ncbi:hypothetical protein C0989_010558 [Termitomyces sp. Mn162]|nr:hypothetical protein C0989_010558 [Termitomyces sp. Mn162]
MRSPTQRTATEGRPFPGNHGVRDDGRKEGGGGDQGLQGGRLGGIYGGVGEEAGRGVERQNNKERGGGRQAGGSNEGAGGGSNGDGTGEEGVHRDEEVVDERLDGNEEESTRNGQRIVQGEGHWGPPSARSLLKSTERLRPSHQRHK